MLTLQQTELYSRLNISNNPAFEYLGSNLLQQDVWDIQQDLPMLLEEAHIKARKTIRFDSIRLLWLRELFRLAALVTIGSQKWGLGCLLSILSAVKDFDSWLIEQGFITPSALSLQVVQHWCQNSNTNRKMSLARFILVLHELGCVGFRLAVKGSNQRQSYPKTIPEEVKERLDCVLNELDKPIYLIFKLLEAAGCRSMEIAKIPLNCLRLREGVYRLRLRSGKQNNSEQEQDIPEELAKLVQAQQVFVRQTFGRDFPWLFPNWQWVRTSFAASSWPPNFTYSREQVVGIGSKLNYLLAKLIEKNNICTRDGNLAKVTTHMFRRTWATVANRMGKRPDQIMHGLRHLNLDMQDYYVNVSPQEQEKHIERVLVDNTGKRTTYRTTRDSEFLRREWRARQVELGVCTRPNIQSSCEYEYTCLHCKFAHYGVEHLPRLLQAREENQQLLRRCIDLGQSDSRRAHSANQFINVLTPIILGLQAEFNPEIS